MRHLEDSEQIAFFQWCEYMKPKHQAFDLVWHTPNGGKRNVIEAVRLKKMGVKAFVPDIFMAYPKPGSCWPHGPGRHGLFIELKSITGVATPGQREMIGKLQNAGYEARICRGWIEAARIVCEYLGIPFKEAGLQVMA